MRSIRNHLHLYINTGLVYAELIIFISRMEKSGNKPEGRHEAEGNHRFARCWLADTPVFSLGADFGLWET